MWLFVLRREIMLHSVEMIEKLAAMWDNILNQFTMDTQ